MIIDYLHRTLLSNFEKINRFLSNVIDYRLTTPGGKDSKGAFLWEDPDPDF